MVKKNLLLLLCFFTFVFCFAQDTTKTITATRVAHAPKIDGILDDAQWATAPIATGFIQQDPDYGKPSSQKTEVKILYDDNAIYIGAFMYDSSPDSILHELGSRDDEDLNADYFYVSFDTYGKFIDAYHFAVSASGIQNDSREEDYTYDAVWKSAVKVNDKGWVAELLIPYSAIRFPSKDVQTWNVEFARKIRRIREYSNWTFIPKNESATIKYYGKLEGIANIKAPLRLSLSPYIAGYAIREPDLKADGTYTNSNSLSYSAGADFKFGIDERFTLDMILLPDFGQVQSDNKIKNLSYREVTYDENRPFFKEGTELFSKNGLFYTRRIGRTPTHYFSVPFLLNPGETLISNPSKTKLINASKISGRYDNGFGLGVFNAVTDNMRAVIKDSLGNEHKVLTEPLTNYNVTIVDKQLKNSSSVYFINTNVTRDQKWDDANATGTGGEFYDKKNKFRVAYAGAMSRKLTGEKLFSSADTNTFGYKYRIDLGKVSGLFHYGIYHSAVDNRFNQLDLGYYITNNYRDESAYISFNQIKPGNFFRHSNAGLNAYYSQNYITGKQGALNFSFNSFAVFTNYLAAFAGAGLTPTSSYDYYEPRVAGRYVRTRKYYYTYIGLSTDYRKRFALDPQINFGNLINEDVDGIFYSATLGLRFRVSDKSMLFYNATYNNDQNNIGFAGFDDDANIIFGDRNLETYSNVFSARYLFKNDLSLTLRGRHYWNTGEYTQYYQLLADGTRSLHPTYSANNNFSYNAFNVDVVFSWQFAPGSLFSVVYKNAIEKDEVVIIRPRFDDNFNATIGSPQKNSFSLKVLYYLDYQYLRKESSRRK